MYELQSHRSIAAEPKSQGIAAMQRQRRRQQIERAAAAAAGPEEV